MVQASRLAYLSSLNDEMQSQANRVRHLIGDSHWLSDGHHKEHLLLSLLHRHLPAGMTAGRGFVLDPLRDDKCSDEQDILIMDTCCEAPLFADGGLYICTPAIVVGAISVKSHLGKRELVNAIEGLSTIAHAAPCATKEKSVWTGAFFFGQEPENERLAISHLEDLSASGHSFNLICQAPNLIYRAHTNHDCPPQIQGFHCSNLATAIFLTDLLDHLAYSRGNNDTDINLITDAQQSFITPIQ